MKLEDWRVSLSDHGGQAIGALSVSTICNMKVLAARTEAGSVIH